MTTPGGSIPALESDRYSGVDSDEVVPRSRGGALRKIAQGLRGLGSIPAHAGNASLTSLQRYGALP